MNSLNNKANRVAIIGAAGYGGIQTLRLLNHHPIFDVTYLSGDRTARSYWNELFPYLKIVNNLEIKSFDPDDVAKNADFAILSLPNGLSSDLTPKLLKRKVRVLDLSADYRYKSLDLWKKTYSKESVNYPRDDYQLCRDAVYGLPEWNKLDIQEADLVACPGCYPTASLLPLMPFIHQGLIETEGIIIDAKSGTSGGGRTPKENLLLSESSESISPYSVLGHRHTSEIEQELSKLSTNDISIQFTPHLVPMVRGLLSVVYARLRDPGLTAEDCRTVLEAVYRNHSTVDILPVGLYPMTKWVRYTNKALISVQVDKRNGRLILMCAIDNLVKGQAGQAIQNLNIMSRLEDNIGLPLQTYYP